MPSGLSKFGKSFTRYIPRISNTISLGIMRNAREDRVDERQRQKQQFETTQKLQELQRSQEAFDKLLEGGVTTPGVEKIGDGKYKGVNRFKPYSDKERGGLLLQLGSLE